MNAKAGNRFQFQKLRFGLGIARQAVGHNANLMTAGRKLMGQVGNMPEQSADRRTHDLQDAKRVPCHNGS
ncbi:hypothetical protein GCM10011499_21580 [Pelagibacterium lentulum]|uniref:Uncharacterized protein n=1 Tax=Pelagibacterium lentulum TaxID=2029865 RepID=A0A916RF52_9HYPH|nr:hypothetical protein GCM10011499_21580 [Pelagibacterium lentulum]